MFLHSPGAAGKCFFLWLLFSLVANFTWAQSETATVSGQVVDPSGLNVAGAQVKLVDIDRDTSTSATTKNTGLYSFPSVRPGHYRMEVTAAGFKVVDVTSVTVNVQDHLEQNFKLVVGSISESITVEGGTPLVDTESATVSTVVDRNFAENLPMNGRSFQSLIQLTPGVVLTANNGVDTGQFSVNGQRANANYWMVDGVSANIGVNSGFTAGSGIAGTLGSTNVFGGTNSLVSVDALQEFRIETSTYAPEFGRQPGAQISIVTRSGTNQFHGTVFDFFRNEALDANDWFNGFTNNPPLPKARERQNDFGGTFGGPIIKDKTFVFFSYEGLRLQLPQTALTYVPDTNSADPYSRQFAAPALLPYLNAFPLPDGPEILLNGNHQGIAQFNASYSDPGTLNAYSLRVDHKISERLNFFARYNYSPSELSERGSTAVSASLSSVSPTTITTQTATVGASWALSTTATDDARFNYSSADASASYSLDSFGGAAPLETLPFPTPFTTGNALFRFIVSALGNNGSLIAGGNANNQQRQINIVDGVSIQKGSHSLKIGVDYRRLSPRPAPAAYRQATGFSDIPSAQTGTSLYSVMEAAIPVTFLFRNLGVFAQDTWHIAPRLTMTYGLRWDVDFVPESISGPKFNAVTGFDLSNLSTLALLPSGTPPYKTKWGDVAPRMGLAYQLSDSQKWETVLRGGFGVFYDLASSEAGNSSGYYPFGSTKVLLGIPYGGTAMFPLSAAEAAPAPVVPPNASNGGSLQAFDPNLESPYTLQWNFAVEQALGKQQTMNVSYIGAVGRRLIQTAAIFSPNPNFSGAELTTNVGTSDYNGLQLQFQRRLSRGLQVLASYSWSHSLDTGSAGSVGSGSNALTGLDPNLNRGSSDFDIRNAFSTGVTYDVPTPRGNAFARRVLNGWSTENMIQARTAPPVNVYYSELTQLSNGFETSVRPDVVAGQPFYLYRSLYPDGKAFNPEAFTSPPLDPKTGLPTSQGDLPRNALRGFALSQWDFAIHREFFLHESLKLQFRAEMFNVLNHPNFGPPIGDLGYPGVLNPQFGQSIQMLGQSLAGGNLGSGAFDPLYQIGGPRSIQLALKLLF
jgi:hypothetical protein